MASARASSAAARTCARRRRSALLKITSEGSSAANVRRIEAVTGPVAVGLMREHDALLRRVADELRTQPEGVAAGRRPAARAGQGRGEGGELQRPRATPPSWRRASRYLGRDVVARAGARAPTPRR